MYIWGKRQRRRHTRVTSASQTSPSCRDTEVFITATVASLTFDLEDHHSKSWSCISHQSVLNPSCAADAQTLQELFNINVTKLIMFSYRSQYKFDSPLEAFKRLPKRVYESLSDRRGMCQISTMVVMRFLYKSSSVYIYVKSGCTVWDD